MADSRREKLIQKALEVVDEVIVSSERGLKVPAKWDVRILEERDATVVSLRCRNGILEEFRIKPPKRNRVVTVKDGCRTLEVRTRGTLIVRIKMKD
jgi:hypothetical protein